MNRALLLFAVGALSLLFTSCGGGSDIAPGSRFAGQQCFSPQDCSAGLTCGRDRTCVPSSFVPTPNPSDMGTSNNGNNATNNATTPMNNATTPANNVTVELCEVGTSECVTERIVEECVRLPNGDTGKARRGCRLNELCEGGACREGCVDEDNDGFFANCEPFDCVDSREDINPEAPERCGNDEDDNCNQQVDEGCSAECCPGGCSEAAFCSQCECVDFDPEECRAQNQPCRIPEQVSNGYVCTDLGEDRDFRCLGLCNTNAAVPDSTCPDLNSACVIGLGNGQGVCLETCTLDRGCGVEGFGCARFQSERGQAACFPVNPNNRIGDRCDPDLFFDCEANAVCIGTERNAARGTCLQACRPFAFTPDSSGRTDCDTGHCAPLSDSFGVCRRDNMFQEDEPCNPPNSMCGEDAVQCFPNGQTGQGSQCFRLCRISRGNDDCTDDSFCLRTNQASDVGACIPMP
ncbi:MAG: hypothetical protein AAGI01_00600 [Myxococcota bacterium]